MSTTRKFFNQSLQMGWFECPWMYTWVPLPRTVGNKKPNKLTVWDWLIWVGPLMMHHFSFQLLLEFTVSFRFFNKSPPPPLWLLWNCLKDQNFQFIGSRIHLPHSYFVTCYWCILIPCMIMLKNEEGCNILARICPTLDEKHIEWFI